MMLTVQNMPDCIPRQQSPTRQASFRDDIRYIDEDDRNIPYHARQDSRPFTYGVNSDMIAETKGLTSPSLVRKATFNKSYGDNLNKVQTQVFPQTKSSYDIPDYGSTRKHNIKKFDSERLNKFNNSGNNIAKYNTYSPSYSVQKYDPYTTNNNVPNSYTREFKEEFFKDETKRYHPSREQTYGTLRNPERIVNYQFAKSIESSPKYEQNNLSSLGDSIYSYKSSDYNDS